MTEIGPDISEINIFPKYPDRFKVTLDQIEERFRSYFNNQETKNKDHIVEETYWKADNFDLLKEINSTKGPIVEIGGPTDNTLLDFNGLNKKLHVSNITRGLPIYDTHTGELVKYLSKVDFQADATALPLRDNSVGALTSAYLPHYLADRFFDQSAKALEPGGLLLFQGGRKRDFFEAIKYGFRPVQYRSERDISNNEQWDIIFKKTNLKPQGRKFNWSFLHNVKNYLPRLAMGRK